MAKVVIDLSVSLDGFVADLDDDPGPIFDWYFSGEVPVRQYTEAAGRGASVPPFRLAPRDAEVFQELLDHSGAVVAGRRTYDLAAGWGGVGPHPGVPLFVVTHERPAAPPPGALTYTFVEDGVASAIEQARAAAGDRWVSILGASVAQRALTEGLVDELRLHVAPVLLGSGIALFPSDLGDPLDLTMTDAVPGPAVTHLTYRVS